MENLEFKAVDGIIENLVVQQINVNFLGNSENISKTAAIVSLIQAATGSPGSVHSAQSASDTGDPVEGFAMNIGKIKVFGNFWKTSFKNGDNVKVIGRLQGENFFAVAVADPVERIIWMQPHCERGTSAKKKHLIICSAAFMIAIGLCVLFIFRNVNTPAWFLFATSAVASFVMLVATVGMSWGDFMRFSRQMNGVGVALKLDAPENVNLFKSTRNQRKLGKLELPMGVYYY
jgi:hypothetical protein